MMRNGTTEKGAEELKSVQSLPKRLQKGRAGGLLAAIGYAEFGILLLTNLLLTGWMDSATFGDYHVALSVMLMSVSLVLMGTAQAANRFIPPLRQKGDEPGLRNYFAWNQRRVGWMSALFVGGSAVLLAAILLDQGRPTDTGRDPHLALYGLFLVPLVAVGVLVSSYFAALGHPFASVLTRALSSNVAILVFFSMAVFLLGLSASDAPVILGVCASAFVTTLVVQTAMFRRTEAGAFQTFLAGFARRPAALDPEWRPTAAWMVVTAICAGMLWHIDILIVEFCASDEASTGYYAAILFISRLLFYSPNYVVTMVRPRISEAVADPSRMPELQRVLDGANLIIFLTSAIVYAGILIFGYRILSAFGEEYTAAFPGMVLFATGAFVNGITLPARNLVNLSGGQSIVSRVQVFALMALVAAGIPATLIWNIEGAAAVSGFILAGQHIVLYVFARRRLPQIRPLSIV